MLGIVNVPGASAADLANKVDKVSGKGLSSYDFDSTYKGKLDNIDTTVTADSSNLVTSGAVKTAVDAKYTASNATTNAKGLVQIGSNISVSSGTISVPTASASTAGVVKIGSGLTISNGVVSVDSSASGPTISYGTTDLTDGVSSLATGSIYFVYE